MEEVAVEAGKSTTAKLNPMTMRVEHNPLLQTIQPMQQRSVETICVKCDSPESITIDADPWVLTDEPYVGRYLCRALENCATPGCSEARSNGTRATASDRIPADKTIPYVTYKELRKFKPAGARRHVACDECRKNKQAVSSSTTPHLFICINTNFGSSAKAKLHSANTVVPKEFSAALLRAKLARLRATDVDGTRANVNVKRTVARLV